MASLENINFNKFKELFFFLSKRLSKTLTTESTLILRPGSWAPQRALQLNHQPVRLMPTAVNRKNALDTQLVFCATGEVSYHNINLQTVCNSWNSNTAFCYAYFKQEIRNVSPFFTVYPEIYIQSAPNNSNETHTFMCLGRAGRFGQH